MKTSNLAVVLLTVMPLVFSCKDENVDSGEEKIEIMSPKENDVYEQEGSIDVKWNTAESIEKVKIELSVDATASFSVLSSSLDASTGSAAFDLPNIQSTESYVKISDVNDPNVNSLSGVFTIGSGNALVWDDPDIPTFIEKDGLVKIEAESLKEFVTDDFTLVSEPEGYSGTGFLRWDGSGHSSGSLFDNNGEHRDGKFVPVDERLIFKFKIKEAGNYRLRIYNYHVKEDGDNDCWLSFPEDDDIWHKVGDNAHASEYGWLAWSYKIQPDKPEPQSRYANLSAGTHYAYYAGRSYGFGVDFVALHKEEYEDKLEDIVAADESERE